jgi:sporulation protein YlmC with PRC-barrel domain
VKASELQKLPVIASTDPARIGKIRDIFLDPGELCVRALLVQSGAQDILLDFSDIVEIRQYCVVVSHSTWSGTRPADQGWRLRSMGELHGTAVAGRDGTYQGDVSDMVFDEESGRIVGLIVKHAGILGIGSRDQLVERAAIFQIRERLVMVQPCEPRCPPRGAGE